MFELSFSNKLRIVHVLNHMAIIPAFIYGAWWAWGVSALVWMFIGTIGISLGFHRYLSHRSFTTYPWFEALMIYTGCLACGGTPLGWAGTHRLHHAHVDTEKDPHSPKIIGFWRSYFHIWDKFHIPPRLLRDLLRNKHVKFCQRHYFKMLIAWASLLCLIDPLVMVFGFCIPGVLAFHAYGHVNAVAHTFGSRDYDSKDETSRNNWWVSVIACFEGWHNNHHMFPNKYRLGIKKHQYDLGAWMLETFGLMKTHR